MNVKKNKKLDSGVFATNKKAYFDYFVLEELEVGVVLTGSEVKSVRSHQVNLKGSFVDYDSNFEFFANGVHISNYKFSSDNSADPVRKRKILLHKKEATRLVKDLSSSGVTLVPLKLYSVGSLIKMKIGLCKGKKLYDKREVLKKKANDMDV